MDDLQEISFPIRSYGKGELASKYAPDVNAKSALKTMNAWINNSPGLKERLVEAGLTEKVRKYTPYQVKLIVSALGTPSYIYIEK